MREASKLLLEHAIKTMTISCKKVAREILATGSGELAVLGLAWSIAQGAATAMREELLKTPEGRALIEQSLRTAAGKRPS